jgi:cytochrome c-type biogenesis protein CcmF
VTEAVLGTAGLVVGLVFGGLGTLVLLGAVWRSSEVARALGQRLLVVAVGGVVVAAAALEWALVSHDFALAYVVQNNARETPLIFSISGMWSALQGSLLLWALIGGAYLVGLLVVLRREADWRVGATALAILGAIETFFVGVIALAASPFVLVHGAIPADGQGPNPLLQQYPLVLVHPPMLYAGLVGMSVPCALATASLWHRRLSDAWLRRIRNWSLVSWVALGIGISLGAWWSYQVLGWGGYWAWDPVENAAVLPWLTTAAYLHLAVGERRRRSLSAAGYGLVAASFALSVLTTYITRSGVLQSVHAFSDSSLGAVLLVLFAISVVAPVAVALARADAVSSSPWARSGVRGILLAANATILALVAMVVLAGTVFPLIDYQLARTSVNVGAPFFDRFVVPLALLALALMAVAPWTRWSGRSLEEAASRTLVPGALAVVVLVAAVAAGVRSLATLAAWALAAFVLASTVAYIARTVLAHPRGSRARALVSRRVAGMIVHIGVAIVAVGMASATTFGHQGQVRIARGRTAVVYGQRLSYEGVRTVVTPQKTAFEAIVRVDDQGTYYPAITQFGTYATPVGTPSIAVSPLRDVYLTIDAPPRTAAAPITLGVVVQPLIFWLWLGAATMAVGGLLAVVGIRLAPSPRMQGSSRRAAADRTPSVVGADG